MERTNFGSNKILLLPLTRIDFAALVSSRAVRISSRAVRVFPALSLRRVRTSYGTFSLMVLQGNCARGRTGHMINAAIFIFPGVLHSRVFGSMGYIAIYAFLCMMSYFIRDFSVYLVSAASFICTSRC